ncbi:Putative 2EXR domain-containing protein [Colletotrichum destructivum]|uniref:2EXR domain-containing protein n=1 Tax=Colletotrichum destructivum TaxID=34406 RepID=A0AAX4I6G6_9PEZI|nr:Putative 2EXR domain-containing protein [Colletotrichum destructivum]
MTTTTTAIFHQFTRPSPGLRAPLWELTVEPRIVDVRVVYHRPDPLKFKRSDLGALTDRWMDKRLLPIRHLRLSTPALVQLQACHEACDNLRRHPDI